jgi:predicted lipid-binding transport protein (Tim44 family)
MLSSSRMLGRCATTRSCRYLATARRPLAVRPLAGAAPPAASRLEPPVVDSFDPDQGVLRNFRGWAESTMAVVQLRKSLPGWAVPDFKVEAATLYEQVSLALAAKDAPKLQRLTTPSCYAALHESLESRPSGQQHSWEAQEIVASVKQVRFTHSANQVDRRYVQVTCGIKCR